MGRAAALTSRDTWLIVIFGVLMSALFTLQRSEHATHLMEWRFFLNFQGEHPFQARVLPFVMARIVTTFHRLGNLGLFHFFLTVDFIATCVAFHFVWKMACLILQDSRARWLAVALFWWQMWVTFVFSPVHNYYYPYDMMSLAFIALAMWATVSGQGLRRLLWITVPAMFNRETAIVIPFFYLAWHWPASKTVLRDTLILLAVCVCIKLGISQALRAHDEMVSLYHVPGFLRFYYNFSFITLHPELVHTANAFLMLGVTWVLLPWRSADARLRRMMWCFVPYFLGMMVVGNLAEIRIFAEFIPLMTLLLASKFFVPEGVPPVRVGA
jgi:hypothetical protein